MDVLTGVNDSEAPTSLQTLWLALKYTQHLTHYNFPSAKQHKTQWGHERNILFDYITFKAVNVHNVLKLTLLVSYVSITVHSIFYHESVLFYLITQCFLPWNLDLSFIVNVALTYCGNRGNSSASLAPCSSYLKKQTKNLDIMELNVFVSVELCIELFSPAPLLK